MLWFCRCCRKSDFFCLETIRPCRSFPVGRTCNQMLNSFERFEHSGPAQPHRQRALWYTGRRSCCQTLQEYRPGLPHLTPPLLCPDRAPPLLRVQKGVSTIPLTWKRNIEMKYFYIKTQTVIKNLPPYSHLHILSSVETEASCSAYLLEVQNTYQNLQFFPLSSEYLYPSHTFISVCLIPLERFVCC